MNPGVQLATGAAARLLRDVLRPRGRPAALASPASSSSCCATRRRCPATTSTRSRRMLNFDGPTTRPGGPRARAAVPHGVRRGRRGGGGVPPLHRGRPARRQGRGAATVIDALEDAGLPPEPEERLVIDVELDHDEAMVWMKTLTDLRLALATRLEIERGRRGLLAPPSPRTTRGSRHTHSTSGSGSCRRRCRRPPARRFAGRTGCRVPASVFGWTILHPTSEDHVKTPFRSTGAVRTTTVALASAAVAAALLRSRAWPSRTAVTTAVAAVPAPPRRPDQ